MLSEYSRRFDRSRLIEQELETLYQISMVLNSPLSLRDKLQSVLDILHNLAGMSSGLMALRDRETDILEIRALRRHKGRVAMNAVSYRPGDGLVETVMDIGTTIVLERITDEPRFSGKLDFYDVALPFIGVPIRVGDDAIVGVLTAQPANCHELSERARFMEMVANLIAESAAMLRAVEQKTRKLSEERDRLEQCLHQGYGFEHITGHSPVMLKVFEQVRQVAKWNTTVLIRGESGTGKELIANAIHHNSACADGPFIKLNCPALADNLLESELFGHEKGAFSGALSQHKGRFELGNHGTIFLDEIGEISLDFQTKLLRVLQEGEFDRVGSSQTVKVQVRIIAATNRNLEQAVQRGEFREDLYYRLNVMPIDMPSLRERLEDIPELAKVFLLRISERQGGRSLEIKDSAIRLLMRHDWPGNVRELENTLERASIMSHDGVINRETIARTGLKENFRLVPFSAAKTELDAEEMDERERVIAALEQAGWVQAKAARLLNMTPRKIAYRVRTLNIQMKHI
ncbi:nif-specific transcriptional activator NifA [Candidatus Methylobacter oryzae]|uniref:Nif-specific regulatory protein n=1 Tax=Candidatus Methylobacter oryzae TaxID=2497749 RepID=A0ABY3C507_9GAMM|nr:nif-specific transcriptional activator NifA [Candidatus Methylobacter oryzae]TRW89619.1 nif-specific transcriptional activator NifA [Candidatus Methylobacter oryzae]